MSASTDEETDSADELKVSLFQRKRRSHKRPKVVKSRGVSLQQSMVRQLESRLIEKSTELCKIRDLIISHVFM